MKELVFATGNKHKIREVYELLGSEFKLKSLKDIGCPEELPESSPTIEGNALQKARYVNEVFGLDCFAEDTGLEVEALGGEPGVHSARYAGENKNPDANIELLLEKLTGVANRKAQFRTVVALILNGKEFTFEGKVEGVIRQERSGAGGFGYDPVFQADGFSLTFAEMPSQEKNAISHRGHAIRKLIDFLKGLSG